MFSTRSAHGHGSRPHASQRVLTLPTASSHEATGSCTLIHHHTRSAPSMVSCDATRASFGGQCSSLAKRSKTSSRVRNRQCGEVTTSGQCGVLHRRDCLLGCRQPTSTGKQPCHLWEVRRRQLQQRPLARLQARWVRCFLLRASSASCMLSIT